MEQTKQVYLRSKLAQNWQLNIGRADIQRRLMLVKSRARLLKPGALRLLTKMHRIYERRGFESYLTRSQIALLLQHTKLHRYDRLMIDSLVAAQLLRVERRALPLRETDYHPMPRGAEYRYSMSVEVGWLLSVLRKA